MIQQYKNNHPNGEMNGKSCSEFFCIFFLPTFDQMGTQDMSGGLLDPCPAGGLTLKHIKILHPHWQKSDKSCLEFFCVFSCHLFAEWVP